MHTNREEGGYNLASYLDKGYCNKEEEYQSISEGDEESEELTKALDRERGYKSPTTPHT